MPVKKQKLKKQKEELTDNRGSAFFWKLIFVLFAVYCFYQ